MAVCRCWPARAARKPRCLWPRLLTLWVLQQLQQLLSACLRDALAGAPDHHAPLLWHHNELCA